jgi:hypothetical protein
MSLIIRLRAEAFDGRSVCCLGSQLARLVAELKGAMGEVVWYAADIDLVGPAPIPRGRGPQLLGGSDRLIELAEKVDQLLRGVFLAVPADNAAPHFRDAIDTEDPVDVELGDARVEIRAFDTTYFEVLTTEPAIATFAEDAFGVGVASE